MADERGAIIIAATWWAGLACLTEPGDETADAVRLHIVTRIWDALDPLVREPLADVVFPLEGEVAVGTRAALWSFAMRPRPTPTGSPLLDDIARQTLRRFAGTRRRLTQELPSGNDVAAIAAGLREVAGTVGDYAWSGRLFDRAESAYRRMGWPTWFSYPDDLAIVEFAMDAPARFLMTRRSDRWFVLLPPETFDELDRRAPGNGDGAGVREPRAPLLPVQPDEEHAGD